MGAAEGLAGTGPWSLVEVADALGLSYDTVCRDVRRGLLPARRAAVRHGARYLVQRDDLARAGRAVYRTAARTLDAPPTGSTAV
jgi:hypothetical protein